MRWVPILLGAGLLLPGCTHLKLERSTLKQASTLSDLQYQQVLDNLAVFSCNSEALAWHVKLKSGTVQITDLVGSSVSGVFWSGQDANSVLPGVNSQRTVLGQWDVEPAVDSDELEILQLAYKKAVLPDDKETDVEIRFQMWQLILTYNFAPGASTLLSIMKDAVDARFQTLASDLTKTGADPGLRGEVNSLLDDAKDALAQLLDLQLTFNLPKYDGDKELLKFTDRLSMPPSPNRPPLLGASNFEENYAANFDSLVARYLHDLELAGQKLATSKAVGVTSIGNQIYHMHDEKRLRRCVQDLNPVRRRAISRAKGEKPSADEPPFPGQYEFLELLESRKYLIAPVKGLDRRNVGLVDQAQTKVESLKEFIDEDSPFRAQWFYSGSRKDVPQDACYVGRYSGCGRDCYVWIMPEGLKTLREFTILLQSLAPLEKQDVFMNSGVGTGAAFSPGLK
jgi:hypothetical protein